MDSGPHPTTDQNAIRATLIGKALAIVASALIFTTSAPAAQDGESAAQVREVQYLLQKLGYDPGPETGEVSEPTLRAIRGFMADTGRTGDPLIDQSLITALETEWKKRTEPVRERLQPEGPTPGLPTPPEGKTYPPDHLTLEQIRRCVIDKISSDQQRTRLEDELRGLNEAVAALNETAAVLQGDYAALDSSDEAAVDAYNVRVEAYRARVREHEAGPMQAYERRAAEWNALQAELNQRCANKPVWRDDLDRVKQDLGLKRFPFSVVSGP